MTAPTPKIKITSLGNVVEILPYLLGYHPDNSMVLHLVGTANFIDGPTMVLPLPDDPADWQETAATFACRFAHTVHHRGHDTASGILIYVCSEPRPGHNATETAALLRPVAARLADTLREHRGTVLQSFGIVSDRWWGYECPRQGCCEGEPIPTCIDTGSVGAQLIRLGYPLPRHPSGIVQEFQPTEPKDNAPLLTALANEGEAWTAQCATPTGQGAVLQATHALLDTAMADFRAGATELADDIAAQLIYGLHDEWAQDHGLEFIEDDDLPHARQLWAFLARRCIPPYDDAAVPALTLLAAVAWRQNDLPTARFALRRALAIDPTDEFADALHGAINNGVDATTLLAIARKAKAERHARTHDTDTDTI